MNPTANQQYKQKISQQISQLSEKGKQLLDDVVLASIKGDSEALKKAKKAADDYTYTAEFWLGRAK